MIPLGQKDFWNRSEPEDDAQFDDRYDTPELARPRERALRSASVGTRAAALQCAGDRQTGRTDLDAILLTGVHGPELHRARPSPTCCGSTPRSSRASTARARAARPPPAAPDRLAVLDGDLCGFPNGRRLDDDVVDIELRAVAQGYGPFLNSELRAPEQEPEQPRRRRRGRERRAVHEHVPVRRCTASGLRGAVGTDARKKVGGAPAGAPPAPANKSRSTVKPTRLIVGAGTAAATATALLLGGIFRESSAATPTRRRRGRLSPTGSSQSGFSAGAKRRSRPSRSSRRRCRRDPGRRQRARAARPRLPAAGARDRRPDLLHEVGAGPRPGAAPRAARPRRHERARLARALAPPLRRGARRSAARHTRSRRRPRSLRHHRRRARRARPLPRGIQGLRHDGDAEARASPPTRASPTGSSCSAACRGDRHDEARRPGFRGPGRAGGLGALPARQALLVDRPGRTPPSASIAPRCASSPATTTRSTRSPGSRPRKGHYRAAIALEQQAVDRIPLPQYVAQLGDLYRVDRPAGAGARSSTR